MTTTFLARLIEAIRFNSPSGRQTRALLARSIVDTLAVAAAGFCEPVTREALHAYTGRGHRTWSGASCESAEAAVFVNAVASHALDFDDVLLDSAIHPSVSILAAILSDAEGYRPDQLFDAFAAGLIAARAIGRRVGVKHYYRGWHATGTYGAFAAAAALARLRRLNAAQVGAALSLAAAQSGGLKLNFGTGAKACHAGFAAVAGYRAVRLAAAGIDAAPDAFEGPLGYAALYGGGDGDADPDPSAFEVRPDRVSIKLYPCCYAAHRLIGLALDAHRAAGPQFLSQGGRVVLTVPKGSVDLIRYDEPRTALQAKFSAKYCFAVALDTGKAGLPAFTDEAVQREGLRALLGRVDIVEDPDQPDGADIEYGEISADLWNAAGVRQGRFTRKTIPGSPASPPDPEDVASKVSDCLALFRLHYTAEFAPLAALMNAAEFAEWTSHDKLEPLGVRR